MFQRGPTDLRNFDPIITCVPATITELPTSPDRHFHIDGFDYTAANPAADGGMNGTPGGGSEGPNGGVVVGGGGMVSSGTQGGGGEDNGTEPQRDYGT